MININLRAVLGVLGIWSFVAFYVWWPLAGVILLIGVGSVLMSIILYLLFNGDLL